METVSKLDESVIQVNEIVINTKKDARAMLQAMIDVQFCNGGRIDHDIAIASIMKVLMYLLRDNGQS